MDCQELTLNHNHHLGRCASSAGMLEDLKQQLHEIRERVIENIAENIRDQCDKTTVYYFCSFTDFELRDDLECWKEKLNELLKILCSSTVHEMEEKWNGYQMIIEYTRLTDASSAEVLEEFERSWPTLNRLWSTYQDDSKKGKDVQLSLLQKFIKNNITFPNLCKLLMILIASAANTSPLERPYSTLEIVCDKGRANLTPETMEILYLLGVK